MAVVVWEEAATVVAVEWEVPVPVVVAAEVEAWAVEVPVEVDWERVARAGERVVVVKVMVERVGAGWVEVALAAAAARVTTGKVMAVGAAPEVEAAVMATAARRHIAPQS